MFMGIGGIIVKCAPTFKPQTLISMMRLKERLNEAGFSRVYRPKYGYIIRLGKAKVIFLSADVSSNIVGATAHIPLEIDEAQDVPQRKLNKDFKSKGATTNATTVLYRTSWDNCSFLEGVKQTNLELEKRDGMRRHFSYDWQEVAKYNPLYLQYVEGERRRLGEEHPLFLTQCCFKPLGGRRFLNYYQRAQLQSAHHPLHYPEGYKVYIAGIEIAGERKRVRMNYCEG